MVAPVIAWVGAGYVLANPLALVITALIGAFYVMGVLELNRFRLATNELGQAVDELAQAPDNLGAWLERVPAALRNAPRQPVDTAFGMASGDCSPGREVAYRPKLPKLVGSCRRTTLAAADWTTNERDYFCRARSHR